MCIYHLSVACYMFRSCHTLNNVCSVVTMAASNARSVLTSVSSADRWRMKEESNSDLLQTQIQKAMKPLLCAVCPVPVTPDRGDRFPGVAYKWRSRVIALQPNACEVTRHLHRLLLMASKDVRCTADWPYNVCRLQFLLSKLLFE